MPWAGGRVQVASKVSLWGGVCGSTGETGVRHLGCAWAPANGLLKPRPCGGTTVGKRRG